MRTKSSEDQNLIELFDPIADSLGLDIVRLRMMGALKPGGARRLQIMAERKSDGEITVNQCARLSRAISRLLEESDPIEGEYILEVSSPGVDRPLTRLKDFDTYQGFEARLELDRLAEGRKRFRGTLHGTEEGHVAIDLEGDTDTAMIPFEWIIDAKLLLSDELLKRGAELRALRGDEPDDDDPDFEEDDALIDDEDMDQDAFANDDFIDEEDPK